jgi:metal-responsive CopG/Arc/MetJ family transcriptional regulator
MRLHIHLDDDLVAELDRRAGRGRRSAFISDAVKRALEEERRWELIESAIGTISRSGHPWDDDPARWVREQRSADARRVG